MQNFIFPVEKLPSLSDTALFEIGLEDWLKKAENSDDESLTNFMTSLPEHKNNRKILKAVFGNSPYLTQSILKEPAFFKKILSIKPDVLFTNLIEDTRKTLKKETDLSSLMKKLRIFKRQAALLTALADISEIWELKKTTRAISDTADTALQIAVSYLLRTAAKKGEIVLHSPDDAEKDSGLIILGMGKLGAYELNYSSDIDIIVLYNAEKVEYIGKKDVRTFFIKLTRNLIKIIDERTADGYVFRTDLRIRPDPSSTPVAISVLAAEQYYEGFGQNWERAAMIKARPVAGDKEAGYAFLKILTPFIWRKSLDFQAILDIHSIKRQINSHHTNSSIGVEGHNIKLGRGGIREIEFYAQTQQLIWGGKNPDLRTSGSCESLKALAKAGLVEEKVSIRLIEAYRFLRKLEHRLQMTNDAQTHTLPKKPEELHNLAVFTGYDDIKTFKNEVLSHLKTVEHHYAKLFEEAPSLSDSGNLVFTGSEHDPDTLETLCSMGFSNAKSVSDTIKGWHHGRYSAMRTTRARELLTELTPELLKTICETVQPDDAFFRFDDFLKGLPSGVQLFTLFHSNPKLLKLVAEIMGDAPRLAKYLSQRPSLLDNVLAPDFFAPLPPLEYLESELKNILHHTSGYEDILDKCRRWAKDRSFQVGVQTLQNLIDGKRASIALTDIADVVLNKLQPYVEKEFAKKHGHIKGSGLAIIALGKMGGQEMTATSDADLIFVYDVPNGADKSDGKHPLPVSTYFARLVQRCVNSITSLTAEGRLWEVDMRLRPSGNAGPVATSLDAFAKYHKEAAWTWEHMALTKARVITGSEKLKKQINKIITDTLCCKREPEKLRTDVANMRNLIFSEHGTETIWNIKHIRGGLVDIGFIIQYLQLKHAHQNSDILCTTTSEAIKQLGKHGILNVDDTLKLSKACNLWQTIQSLLSQTMEGSLEEEKAPDGLKNKLAAIIEEQDIETLKKIIAEHRTNVLDIYNRVIAL